MRLKEERLIQKIIPRLERRIAQKVTQQVMNMIHEEFYPPEAMLRKSFVTSVEAASRRLKEGKGKIYSRKEFKSKFLGKK